MGCKETLDNNITIVVASCDLYEDAWMPFFKLMQINWPNCKMNKVLLTESKEYKCDFMEVKTIKSGFDCSWSQRIKKSLKQIDTKYILFFLEDFFLLDEVDEKKLDKALTLMEKNERVGVINFYAGSSKEEYRDKCREEEIFCKVPKSRPYRTKVITSLWKKDCFEKLLYGNESPWEHEKESSIRSVVAGFDVYEQDYKISKPTFLYYINPKDQMGITKRKWLKGNKEFFESKGIYNVNFENLGTIKENLTYKGMKEEHITYSKENKKQYMKTLSVPARIKEVLYDVKKKCIKMLRLDQIKKYIKYWNYYRKLDKK